MRSRSFGNTPLRRESARQNARERLLVRARRGCFRGRRRGRNGGLGWRQIGEQRRLQQSTTARRRSQGRRSWRAGRRLGLFHQCFPQRLGAGFLVLAGSHHGHDDGEAKEYARAVFGDFGQDVAGACAKQGVGRAAAKGQPGPGILFGQLQQHQENQNDTIQKHQEGQKDVKNTHSFPLNRVFDDIRKTAVVQ